MIDHERMATAELHPVLDGDRTCVGYGWVTGVEYDESDNMWHTTIHCNRIGMLNAIAGLSGGCDRIHADRCEKCGLRKAGAAIGEDEQC